MRDGSTEQSSSHASSQAGLQIPTACEAASMAGWLHTGGWQRQSLHAWQRHSCAHAGAGSADRACVADALRFLGGLCKVPMVNQLAARVAGYDAEAEEAARARLLPPSPSYSAILRQMEDREAALPGMLQHSRSLPASAVRLPCRGPGLEVRRLGSQLQPACLCGEVALVGVRV